MDSDTIRQMLAEATPGPWQIGELLPSMVFNWSVPPDHRDAVIADGATEANARLIAAAPDLAAEVLRLRLLLGQANSLLGQWGSFGCPDCGGDCASANPPVIGCLPQATASLLNDIRATLKEADNA